MVRILVRLYTSSTPMRAAVVLPEYYISNFEDHVKGTLWLAQNIPEERVREEGVKRAIAAAKKLMLVTPDEVQQKVVEDAEKLREQLPNIEQPAELISHAMTISLLLMLLAALKELKNGVHGGDIAEAISFAIREEVEFYRHGRSDIEEFKKGIDEQMDRIIRVYGEP